MLIRIYEEAEKRRKEREPWEAIRIEMEAEQRQRMKVVEAIQYEIDQTRELLNKSEDYKIASQIRAYLSALEKSEDAEQNSERIEWAKNKADWYDPVVSKEDPIFA